MSKLDEFDGIIEPAPKWKNKYPLEWCDLCDCLIFICEKCKNSTCNGGSCKECHEDMVEFNKAKLNIHDYITPEEFDIYIKIGMIKKQIIAAAKRGQTEIDWQELDKNGELCQLEQEWFLNKQ